MFELSEELNEQGWFFLTNALWIKFFRSPEPEEGPGPEIGVRVGSEERRKAVLRVFGEKIAGRRRVEEGVRRRWVRRVERAVRV